MKHSNPFVPLLLGVALLPQWGQAKPAQNAPKTQTAVTAVTLPAEVRAMMAPDATTVQVAKLPIGAHGAPILLHAWGTQRRSRLAPSGANAPALYCIDLFYSDPYNQKKWELAASTAYLSEGAIHPGGITYTTRWLHPDTKQGVVIVETTTQEIGGIIRLITLPDGVENAPISVSSEPFVQAFHPHHSGGGSSIFVSFGTDKARGMTVEEEILPHAVAPQIKNTYAWDGTHWAKVATRKIERH